MGNGVEHPNFHDFLVGLWTMVLGALAALVAVIWHSKVGKSQWQLAHEELGHKLDLHEAREEEQMNGLKAGQARHEEALGEIGKDVKELLKRPIGGID